MRAGIEIDGAVVAITGASSGIGRGSARLFARHGARVVLISRGASSLSEAEKECQEEGAETLAISADVASSKDVENAVNEIIEKFGRIDAWVNNAGVMAYGELGSVPGEVEQRIIEVNLIGQMNCVRAVLPHMVKQQKGVFINVASLYSRMTSPFVASYSTSKFGVLGMSRILRQELKQYQGIHVCTILPGSLDTPIFNHAANYTGHAAKPPPPVSSPGRVEKAILRNTRRPRRHVVIGRAQQLASIGHMFFPWAYDSVVPVAMRKLALQNEAEPESEGNVFQPLPSTSADRGDWRSKPQRRGLAGAGIGVAALGVALAARKLLQNRRKPRWRRLVRA